MFGEVVEVDELGLELEPCEMRVQLLIFEPTSGRSLDSLVRLKGGR